MTLRPFISCLLASAAIAAVAADEPLWLRNTAISPKGDVIAFTYHGDIFTVPVAGGAARQITSSAAYDTNPVWSPDGATLVFASDRRGSLDIYAVEATGGTPRRLTTHSGREVPLAFLNDTTILFSASLQPSWLAAQGPFQAQVYQLPLSGGRPKMYQSIPMGAVSVGADGRVLYQDRKGYEDVLRKHERSSGTADVWLLQDGKHTKLTSFNGHDMNPVWLPGQQEFLYLSESDGTLNVYARAFADGKERQLTKMQRHPVRSLSVSADGKTLAFSWNGEIYTLVPGAEPKKVDVAIVADDYNADLDKGYRRSGATTLAVSPSGEEVAFVLRGDVYVTNVKYKTTKRITNTDGQERCVEFSPDGRMLVYDSERDGKWQLFTAKIKNEGEKQFAYATDIVEEPLYKSEKTAQQPVFSPDGKKVAFLEDRVELKVIDIDTKAVNTALDGKFNYSYSDGDISFDWSPDSRWLLCDYIGVGGWNNTDIALVKADGSQVVDLTESGYADSNAKWALDGKAFTYESGKEGYKSHGSWGEESDVYLMALDGEGWDTFLLSEEDAAIKEKAEADKKDKEDSDKDKKKDKKGKKSKKDEEDAVEPLVFDLKNRKYRETGLTRFSSHLFDYYLTKKGDKLYYIAPDGDGEYALMVRDIKKGDVSTVAAGVVGSIVPSKNEDALFVLGDGIKKVAIPDGKVDNVEFEAEFSRTPSAERAYIFDHAWQQVKDKFFDADICGVDWDGYAADYRKFLPYINNNYDFAELLSEFLGELNASHTGGRYYAPGAPLSVPSLSAFFDEDYDGPGLKVVEVLPRGPLAKASVDIKPGDIITAIDGVEIAPGADYYPLLEGKAGKKVRLDVKRASGKADQVTVKPRASDSQLLYERWVEHNQHVVDSLSGGRVAYVHVKGMDSPSFRKVYSELLGKYRNCDAVIVDTRYNGGGWLHNDIALLLSGKEYVRYTPRGKYIGSDPFSQWTKPSAMLVNESNYSDAHGTPYAYQTLGIGPVVGAPVPGTMTAVWWETQIDPSLVFGIPQVASLDRNGKVLENQQLNPDIVVYNNPADVQAGHDEQLAAAVRHLLKSLK